MSVFERVKELADKRKISLQKVAVDLGFGENYIYNLKGAKSPAADKLSLIADYFQVSVDYLLGRTQFKNFDDEKKSMSKLYGMDLDYIDLVVDGYTTKVPDFSKVQLRDTKLVQRDIRKALEHSKIILELGGKPVTSISPEEHQKVQDSINVLMWGNDDSFNLSNLFLSVNELLTDQNRVLIYEIIDKLLNEQILYTELQNKQVDNDKFPTPYLPPNISNKKL